MAQAYGSEGRLTREQLLQRELEYEIALQSDQNFPIIFLALSAARKTKNKKEN